MTKRCVALFCGSRAWSDIAAIAHDIEALPEHAVVIAGTAAGADHLATQLARQRGLHTAEMPALWSRFGRAAGPRRNRAMLALEPTCAYAYNLGTPGTGHMIRLLTDAGVPTYIRKVTA